MGTSPTQPKRSARKDGLEQARAQLVQYIKEHRLRNTVERMALLECIYRRRGPFSPEDLVRDMEERMKLSMGTVYNCISLFERLGLIVRVLCGPRMLYERRLGERFVHFYRHCVHCGKVVRESADTVEEALQTLQYTRFTALSMSMCADGICSNCRTALTKAHNQYLSTQAADPS